MYHGYEDLIISPYSSIWFYEDLAEKNGGYENLRGMRASSWCPGCFIAMADQDRTLLIP